MTDMEIVHIFEDGAEAWRQSVYVRGQLAYRHMLELADTFEGWALDRRLARQESAQLLGWSEGLRGLADEVGPKWDPPSPDALSALGFLGRNLQEE